MKILTVNKMKNVSTPLMVAGGFVALWVILTRSYTGYKGQETDSVADRYINKPHVST
jgi:hypothetical protein